MKKVILRLCGGLGNQMFMYAAAKSLALKLGCELYVDVKSGFECDLAYKRKFELGNFNIQCRIATNIDSYRFWGGKFIYRMSRMLGWHLLCPFWKYIKEYNHEINYNLLDCNRHHSTYFIEGYWQKKIYFTDFEEVIRKEFKLRSPLSKSSLNDLRMIQRSDITPVAVGVRRYQEVDNKNLYLLEDSEFYLNSIDILAKRINRPVFFIFTQVSDWVRENIMERTDESIVFISNENEAYEDLYLMTECRHFVISNSTFYWWGAWLSESKDKIVISSNKFPDKDSCLKEWIYLI